VKDLKQNGIVAIKAKIYAQERRHLWKLKGASNTMRVCVCVCMRMRVCACVCVGAGMEPGASHMLGKHSTTEPDP
jgi:hypothetical protein